MMRLCIALFIALLIGSIANLQAAVHTATHTYIVSPEQDKVLVIDRTTGEEKTINIPGYPMHMAIHKDLGYVVSLRSDHVSVIDLKTLTVVKKIVVGDCPARMTILGDMGYVVARSGIVSVICLKTNTLITTLSVGKTAEHMFVYRDFGYIVGFWGEAVSVINLKTNTVERVIPAGDYPKYMAIHGNFGYVVNASGVNAVKVIDLVSEKIIHTIPVGNSPQQLITHKDLGYVINMLSHSVSVVDLQKYEVMKTIEVGYCPTQMVIDGDLGYVSGSSKDIAVLNLTNQKVIKTLKKPNDLTLDLSDTHIYLGAEKWKPLSEFKLKLFKIPYNGIEKFNFFEMSDADQIFDQFQQAALRNDYKAAADYFDIAISSDHPKAYAVAFKAFCHGIWGAPQSDFWAMQFIDGMDYEYFSRLCPNANSPHDFKFKEEIPADNVLTSAPKKLDKKAEKKKKRKLRKEKKKKQLQPSAVTSVPVPLR